MRNGSDGEGSWERQELSKILTLRLACDNLSMGDS